MGMNIKGGIIKGSTFSNFITIPDKDPYFKNTVMLLPGDGTNGANNHVFTDVSTNNYGPLVRAGNVTEGSFTPFVQPPGYWSGYGNKYENLVTYTYGIVGDTLRLGSNNFTMEMWIIPNSDSNYLVSWGQTDGVPYGGLNIGMSGASISWSAIYGSNTTSSNTSFTVSYTDWSHIALVRKENTISMFHNGNLKSIGNLGTGAILTDFSNFYNINWLIYGSSIPAYSGTISNFRLNMEAVYTSNTFAVPNSPLTATANTRLLCFAGPYPGKDYGPYNLYPRKDIRTINNMITYSPFDKPSLLSNVNVVPYVIANKYTPSYHDGSVVFDGSGDYLQMADNDSFSFGSGEFSLECWIYITISDMNSLQYFVSQWGTANKGVILGIGAITAGKMSFLYTTDGGSDLSITDTNTFPNNQWVHVVVCRSANTLSLFVNGLREATTTVSGSLYNSTYPINIGAHDTGVNSVSGYIYGLRTVAGNIYNAAATGIAVPTSPTTVVPGTKFLLSGAGAAIYDATGLTNFETVGLAQTSTEQKKWGNSSIKIGYISSTNSYLRPTKVGSTTSSIAYNFSTGDFTIEFWFYAASTGTGYVIDWRPASTNGVYITLYFDATNFYYYVNSSARITAPVSYAGTWTHVALVRASGVSKMYINGSQQGSNYSDTNSFASSVDRPLIGVAGTDAGSSTVPFYIQDLRISKWLARYTSNTSVVSSQFPVM